MVVSGGGTAGELERHGGVYRDAGRDDGRQRQEAQTLSTLGWLIICLPLSALYN